ncbi:hypothetical protein SAMN05216302_101660 [Nitrosomonas aestuarii]|uniref:Phosphotransferase enzyme family protein n=2 Tax=Nitrosomonas aestuarii TaxID=52441 RepID=A0A1I4CP37_9PROT|nr:hypothetical protein SAMN05216302_101660 [Nitrosomonas aestuarii]
MIQQAIDFIFIHCDVPGRNADYAMNIHIKYPLLIHVIFADGPSFFVKMAEKSDDIEKRLHKEYVAISHVAHFYPGLIPQALHYQVDKKQNRVLLVIEGIEHSAVLLTDILQAKPEFRQPLQHFLGGNDRSHLGNQYYCEKQFAFYQQSVAGLPEDLQRNIQKVSMQQQWDEMIRKLPMIAQHGDLTINNIGLAKKSFILFDWEDYAAVQYAGFDLTTLLVSGCQFNFRLLLSIIEQDRKTEDVSFIKPIVSCIGIPESRLVDLILFHLVLFYKLKSQHGYSISIIDRTKRIITDLADYVLKNGRK